MRKCAYVVVRDQQGQVLLLRRGGASRSFHGTWELPGGKIDEGEDAAQAARRETQEETALTLPAEGLRLLGERERADEDLHYTFFECRLEDLDSHEVQWDEDHEAAAWCSPKSMRKMRLRDAHREILEKEWLRNQIEIYQQEECAKYQLYATTLEKILQQLARQWAPLAVVQVRAKTVSSFAGKCLRKADKYEDPAHDLTDLCGGRLIAPTEHDAQRLCRQIRKVFAIDEDDDTATRHEISAFGYLSVHFIVHAPADCEEILGVKVPESVRELRGEIQVRTLLQHAHSEITHDRLYKGAFAPPRDCLREAARVAAVLESADKQFSRFVEQLDAYVAGFAAHLEPEDRRRRIEDLRLLSDAEKSEEKQAGYALEIAQYSRAAWDWAVVIDALEPYKDVPGIHSADRRLELGNALCRANWQQPDCEKFRRGLELLRTIAQPDRSFEEFHEEPDRIRRATALGCLGLALSQVRGERRETKKCLAGAMRLAPEDPYHIVSFTELDVLACGTDAHIDTLEPQLRQAATTCRRHINAGIEVTRAWLNLSMLHFLLGENVAAFQALCLAAKRTDNPNPLTFESWRFEALIDAIGDRRPIVRDLALTAQLLAAVRQKDGELRLALSRQKRLAAEEPIIIVAGGTGEAGPAKLQRWKSLLSSAFSGFEGRVLSGGTTSGISGIAADLAQDWDLRTIGYLPETLPPGAEIDDRYSEIVRSPGATQFSLREPLQMWTDILRSGIPPENVTVLGIGGSDISSGELAIAWALGARVYVLDDESSAAQAFRKCLDLLGEQHQHGVMLPDDMATWRAIFAGREWRTDPHWQKTWDKAGRTIHESYVKEQIKGKKDANLLPWEDLSPNLRHSNLHQAAYSAVVLEECGFLVRPMTEPDSGQEPRVTFSEQEVEELAEREHGRWNAERLNDGWRFGSKKDVVRKISPHLVPWAQLPEEIREYDRQAVREWPHILAIAGWHITR